jgi:hypothetical protein
MGWTGVKNGRLLELAAPEFDVLFTVDRDFAGLTDRVPVPMGVVILESRSTDSGALVPHMDAVNEAIVPVGTGEVRRVGGQHRMKLTPQTLEEARAVLRQRARSLTAAQLMLDR